MSHPYDRLSPDTILNAVDSQGFESDGSYTALNSYENRVLQIGLNDAAPVVTKFYRPQRWSDQAILEDHQFSLTLKTAEIPVVAPLQNSKKETLFEFEGFRFAVFPKQGGRTPNLENRENLSWIGRFLGRIHQVSKHMPFQHRQNLFADSVTENNTDWILNSPFIPPEYRSIYQAMTSALIEKITDAFNRVAPKMISIHGDVHAGNILWTEEGPHFVDMDDCQTGPAVQDFWMLLSGDEAEMAQQLSSIIQGYSVFCDFDLRELQLIEALRSMRLINYTVWLAKRWDDPAFIKAFTWFDTHAYWHEHVTILEQQLARFELPTMNIY